MVLIGLGGPKGCGKTTVAYAIHRAEQGTVMMSFADPLRGMLSVLEQYAGGGWTQEKEEVIAPLGVTRRRLLQTLGTEWGRNLIHPDLWVMLAEMRLDILRQRGVPVVVIDDVRFEGEAKMIRRHGGIVVNLMREGVKRDDGHVSEAGVLADTTVTNVNADAAARDVLDAALS